MKSSTTFFLRTIISLWVLVAFTGMFYQRQEAAPRPHATSASINGASPVVSVMPPNVNFGDQSIGTVSAPHTFTIVNPGGEPLRSESATILGDDAEAFTVVKGICAAVVVAPGRNCVISVAFSPSKVVESRARVTLVDNDPDRPRSVLIAGRGTNP